MTKNDLLPCPFSKWQVWANPDDEIMMVTEVEHTEHNTYRVSYVTEHGETGAFWDNDRYIIDNIREIDTRADRPAMDLESLKRQVFMNAEAGLDISKEAAAYAVDYLARNGHLKAAYTPERIESGDTTNDWRYTRGILKPYAEASPPPGLTEAEIGEVRKTLEWYGDRRNYDCERPGFFTCTNPATGSYSFEADEGERARKALAILSKGA